MFFIGLAIEKLFINSNRGEAAKGRKENTWCGIEELNPNQVFVLQWKTK